MKRSDHVHLTAEMASPIEAADTGFKSLDELRTFIRIAGEWDASLGIPRPKRPRRVERAQDLGSEP